MMPILAGFRLRIFKIFFILFVLVRLTAYASVERVMTVDDAPVLSLENFPSFCHLVVELFNDGEYKEARIEAARLSKYANGDSDCLPVVRFLRTLAAYMEKGDYDPAVWSDESLLLDFRIRYAYIFGVTLDYRENPEETIKALSFVFYRTDEVGLFWNSGAMLYFILKDNKGLRDDNGFLWKQLCTTCNVWPVEVVRTARKRVAGKNDGNDLPLPVDWVISFYRSQISPAIGNRCLLEPSCSEFMLQACSKYGLWGIPIGMDRFIREPTISYDEKREIIRETGEIRYCDPVSDHVW